MLGRSGLFAPWGGCKYQGGGCSQENTVFVQRGEFSTSPNCPQSGTSSEGLIQCVERSEALSEFPSVEEEEEGMGA